MTMVWNNGCSRQYIGRGRGRALRSAIAIGIVLTIVVGMAEFRRAACADKQIDRLSDACREEVDLFNAEVTEFIDGRLGSIESPFFNDSVRKIFRHGDDLNQESLAASLVQGEQVFQTHCARCHGKEGRGDGPDAENLDMAPYDLWSGWIKWKSTRVVRKAVLEDVTATISRGVATVEMPAFAETLTEDEIESVGRYVLWTKMRAKAIERVAYTDDWIRASLETDDGESEILDDLKELRASLEEDCIDSIERELKAWLIARERDRQLPPESSVRTESSAESTERGRDLFQQMGKGKCAICHGSEGRGDGPWTRISHRRVTGELREEPGLFDDWDRPITPRNLVEDEFGGGELPVDIYRRIGGGIYGTPMPHYSLALTDAEIWDLVNYVLSLRKNRVSPAEGD